MLGPRVLPLIAVTNIGCSPYDPDLGSNPFLCGESEPRCPQGYVCVERVGSDHACLSENVVGDAGGDGSLMCSADAVHEPNETINNPTDVPTPTTGDMSMLAGTICPLTDIDIYRMNVDSTGKNIRVEVTYDSPGGELAVDILNSTGISIRTAMPANNDPARLRADFPNIAMGTYFGRVQGTLKNYTITFIITANPLPP